MYRQLGDFLRLAIRNQSLPPGYRLPSTRALAERLCVSRNTVLNAYEQLEAEGLLGGKIGSGTRVLDLGSRIPHLLMPNIPDVRNLLREAQYPIAAAGVCDPDGTPLYLHR